MQLQKDLGQLDKWSKDYLLKFHPQKCKYMKIGKDNNQFEYKLQNQRLQIVAEEKDLGIIIDDQLNFESHMGTKINKATSMFGLIQQSLQCLDKKNLISLYKALVRTHLDYASSVWAPYKVKLRQKAFGLQTVTTWNNLPDEVVNTTSVNLFKRRLDEHWENQEIRYNYRASLVTVMGANKTKSLALFRTWFIQLLL